ncbi:hypothetical protein [Streptomyces niveus]|uniref:hypothetical protein n=1 Tax=Streptomyces niveus TaxID=193462 RepID=UPI0034354735
MLKEVVTATGVCDTPYTRDQGIGWSEYRLDRRFERVQANVELVALFECEPGEGLLARCFVFHDNDVPAQMSTSYVRWSDVAGTTVADPVNEPWPGGTRAQFGSLGIADTRRVRKRSRSWRWLETMAGTEVHINGGGTCERESGRSDAAGGRTTAAAPARRAAHAADADRASSGAAGAPASLTAA